MRLRTISERNQDKLLKAAQQLNKQCVALGRADLENLVQDPDRTLDLIRVGMTAREFVLTDRDWIEDFFEQWNLLPENDKEQIFESIYQELIKRIEKLQTEGVLPDDFLLVEGVLSSIGGFLSKLAKYALLLLKLLVASAGGANNINPRTKQGLRIFNPFAVYRLTEELRRASVQVVRLKRNQQAQATAQNIAQANAQAQAQVQNPQSI